MHPTITAVVMAYDERDSLERVTLEIEGELRGIGRPYEILIIDDGSRDGTAEIALRLAREQAGVRVVRHGANQGLGGVYRTGFSEARGEFVTFFPADGQFAASIIGDYFPRMDAADLVLGYLPRRKDSLLGRALSLAERLLYRLLFGPFPRFQGILMFRRRLLSDINLRSSGRGWTVLMEFILRCRRGGARIVSVPISMRPRRHGASHVNNMRTIWANLREALALRLKL